MSFNQGALRRTILIAAAGLSLAAVSSAALACDCYGRSHYRYHDGGPGNYSCYGGGYDCGYEGSYFRARYHQYRDRYYGYYRHYDGYDRNRDCNYDCR
jgi:hypothetical protein